MSNFVTIEDDTENYDYHSEEEDNTKVVLVNKSNFTNINVDNLNGNLTLNDDKKESESLSFFNKKQREELVKSMLKEEELNKEMKIKENIKHIEEFKHQAKFKRPLEVNSASTNNNYSKDSSLLNKKRDNSGFMANSNINTTTSILDNDELQEIKNQYLHKAKPSKIKPKKIDKNKVVFNFDWDPKEDTSQQSLLKHNTFEPKIGFGKSRIAGYDEELQLNCQKEYEDLLLKRDKKFGFIHNDNTNADNINMSGNNQLNKNKITYEDVDTKSLDKMTKRDWKIFRENNNIVVKSDLYTTPLPMRSWKESTLTNELYENLRKIYKQPTPIQMQTIPIGLLRRDCLGLSPTGSGKSAAFLIPLIQFLLEDKKKELRESSIHNHNKKINKEKHRNKDEDYEYNNRFGNKNSENNSKRLDALIQTQSPSSIILAPTRDLAQQIEEEFIKLTQLLSIKLKSVCLVGGKSIEEQYSVLSNGVDLVVGAPGRVKDCIERAFVNLEECVYVVIDEADKMIKDGFEEDMVYILNSMNWSDREVKMVHDMKNSNNSNQDNQYISNTSSNTFNSNGNAQVYNSLSKANHLNDSKIRTLMMFSATMSSKLEKLAKQYLKNPAHILINREEQQQEIKHIFEITKSSNAKYTELRQLLGEFKPPIMIFVNHKISTNEILKYVEKLNYRAIDMHGDKTQDMREKALRGFKKGDYDILISTSLLARGIDVAGISLVINFDAPNNIEDYEHRTGRTGRAGKKGTAVTFLTDNDSEFASLLAREFEKKGRLVPEELFNASKGSLGFTA